MNPSLKPAFLDHISSSRWYPKHRAITDTPRCSFFDFFFGLNAWLKLNNCPSQKANLGFPGWRCPRAFSRRACAGWWEFRPQRCGKQMNFTAENVMCVTSARRPTWLRANYMCACAYIREVGGKKRVFIIKHQDCFLLTTQSNPAWSSHRDYK